MTLLLLECFYINLLGMSCGKQVFEASRLKLSMTYGYDDSKGYKLSGCM